MGAPQDEWSCTEAAPWRANDYSPPWLVDWLVVVPLDSIESSREWIEIPQNRGGLRPPRRVEGDDEAAQMPSTNQRQRQRTGDD